MKDETKRFAILIDADNIASKYITTIMEETAIHGEATIRRIYGNWTSQGLTPWKEILLDYSITPIQQYSYTSGKNSTDCAMIIDAMDILYTESVDGFCIVSSDGDFTRLASRLGRTLERRDGGLDRCRKQNTSGHGQCLREKLIDHGAPPLKSF